MTTAASPHPVHRPVASTADVVELVRDAASNGMPLRIAGAATWLDANRPVQHAQVLSVAGLAGIVEYEPGDLTLTAGAGTTLAEIGRVTAEHGQWLTLDPYGTDTGSIGATVATASAGPLAHAFGTPRDLVLGLECVTGRPGAAVVRAGGRVVKNVAGFDLVRLLTGAWGSLGILTELTVRLRARPELDRTLAVAIAEGGRQPPADTTAGVARLLAWLRSAPFTPMAFELVDSTLAARLGLDPLPLLIARIGGNEPDVRAQAAAIAGLGDTREVGTDIWTRLRAAEPPSAAVVRLSLARAEFASTWSAAGEMTRACQGAFAHASPGRGLARVILPSDGDPDTLRNALAHAFGGTRVYERLPAPLWPALAPSRVADRLSLGIRRTFDPTRILNPGILGDTA